MTVASALLGVWLALTPHGSDANEMLVDREGRLSTIATAVAAETSSDLEAALVAATIEHEGEHLSRRVHTGERKGDGGKAWCLGQVHAQSWLPKADMPTLVGDDLESTRNCIRAVVRFYRGIGCTTRGKINAYATGRGCRAEWSGAAKRERRVYYYLGKIRTARAAERSAKRYA